MGSKILPADTVQKKLAELARLFASQLPGKVAQMRALLDAQLNQGWDQTRGEDLHRMAHSLAGTGGTMGLHRVSQCARQLELLLKGTMQDASNLHGLQAELYAALDQLQDAAREKYMPTPDVLSEIAAAEPLRILVVDDDPIGQALLAAFLKADGHTVTMASDGEQGVAQFKAVQPDLVFMDVLMPNMNGYIAAQQIKAACGKQFVPLIFLTALHNEEDLAKCIAAGGDDFIVKPYNHVLLKAKLIAMQRIRKLHQALARYQEKTAEEIELSQHVFEAITNHNPTLTAVQQWHSAVGHFSGDIVLFGQSPTGRLVLMLGDFTGHGLGAALAAVPTSDLFYRLVGDETALADLVLALNRKLKEVLPMGRFCAALLLTITPDGREVEMWNGGIPGAYRLNRAGEIAQRITSTKLPLGVIGDLEFDASTERLSLAPGDCLVCFSDGLNEARNPHGDMLTVAGTEKLFGGKDPLADLRTGVIHHLDGQEADDDISIVVIRPDQLAPTPG